MLEKQKKVLEEEVNDENVKKVQRCINLIDKILDKTEKRGIGFLKGLN